MEIVAGAPAALARLEDRGFLLLVVTNQPDVARGTQNLESHPGDAPSPAAKRCRSTSSWFARTTTGMLRLPQARCPACCSRHRSGYGIDLRRSFLVGDRWRDVDAGRAAGCRTVFLDFGYRERGPSAPPDARVASLAEAVDWILKQAEKEEDDPERPFRS